MKLSIVLIQRVIFFWIFLAGFVVTIAAPPSDNGRGRHKQLYAVPVPGSVVIDGKLNDWDLSAQIEMFVVEATRSTQSGRFALMYDEQALYLSGDVNDPTPMMNRHDPEANANFAWDADSCQFRLTIDPAVGYPINAQVWNYGEGKARDTRDDITHLLLWHYTDDQTANLQMHLGMTYRSPRKEWEPHGLVPRSLFEGKYLKRPDGTGYSFEYRIPWSTLGAKSPLKGNDIVAGTVQFNWSRPDGLKTAGGSAWAYDVMSGPGFTFQSTACWGKVIFSPKGNVPREMVSAGVPPEFPLPLEFTYELPQDSECTIQLFDKQNKSVRILVPQQQRMGGKNIERWDGLDSQGNLLPPGKYTWRGIYHKPIKAKYRFSVHNSGQPPYPTDDNTGGWGADHGAPQTACALPDGMLLTWDAAEYGWGLIRTDIEGKKQWGTMQGAKHLATDGKLIFLAGGHGFHRGLDVKVLDLKDARVARFASGASTIPAPAGGDEKTNHVTGLAYAKGKLYVAYGERNLIGVFSSEDGSLLQTFEIPEPQRLAVRPDESLAVISRGKVILIKDGKQTPWLDAHLDEPIGIAVADDGTTYVANRGKLQNVSVFKSDGSFSHSIGRTGGRPAKGKYDASGMYMAGGIALDTKGRLWVAETTDSPKRISMWDTRSGKNLKEFFGSSGYFAYGFIDPARPNEMFAHNVLWEIDWKNYTSRPITTVWRETEPNMMNAVDPHAYGGAPRIITANNGRQYMSGGHVYKSILLRRDGDLFKPFAALIDVARSHILYHGTKLSLIDDNDPSVYPEGSYFWQDANDDQIVQAEELSLLPKELGRPHIKWVDADLSVRLHTGQMLRPVKVMENGQPIYDIAKVEKTFLVGNPLFHGGGGYVMHGPDGEVYTLSRDELVAWSSDGRPRFRYSGVKRWHDSLNLPIVKAGRLWGTTGPMGVAGDFFAHQTYFGINHVFRRDGMYVGALLRDGRLGGRGPYEGQPEGQGGYFGKLNINGERRYILIHGGQDSRVWEVLNLDTIKDLPGGVYHHSQGHVAQAKAAQEAYAAALEDAQRLTIVRGRAALDVAEPVEKTLEGGRGFAVRLAYDADNLYVRYDVTAKEPLANAISDPQIIFRGGNLLDLQLATDPAADAKRTKPAAGDVRLLITHQKNQPMAVLYCPKIAGFKGEPIVLSSPTGTESFDAIEVISDLKLEYRKTNTGFNAIATVPLQRLGLKLSPGQKVMFDAGYIFGNGEGTRAALRTYLKNNSFTANVVDDIPHESRLEPAEWGTAMVE